MKVQMSYECVLLLRNFCWGGVIFGAMILYFVCEFSSVAQSCLTLCDLVNCSTPGFPVHH